MWIYIYEIYMCEKDYLLWDLLLIFLYYIKKVIFRRGEEADEDGFCKTLPS